MDRGDTHSVKSDIELLPWRFTKVVIICFILLNIWVILITLHDIIIFFNTLTSKGISRVNNLIFCFEFFCHHERHLFFTLHPVLMWSKYSTAVFISSLKHISKQLWWWKQIFSSPSWPNSPALHSNISWISFSRSVNFTVPVVRRNSNLWLRHILS